MVGSENNQIHWQSVLAPCDLWVLPTPRDSRWFARMDWYLNFQMCKGLAYGGLHLPEETHTVAQQYGVPMLHRDEKALTPLMIAPSGRLPAERCVVLERTQKTEDWLKRIHKLATDLQVKTLRVFLPQDCSAGEAEKLWPGALENVFFTADLETAR